MSVTVYGAPLSIRDAIARGLHAVGATSIEVHWTPDFVSKVRELTEFSQYSSDRGSGTVAAKTIKTSDGSVVIVFNAEIADPQMAEESGIDLIERTAAHEGAHALQRAIDVERLVPNQQFGDYELWNIGHTAVSEFLVERMVYGAGYPASGWCNDGFQDLLDDLDHGIVSAVVEEECALDPALFSRRILQVYDTAAVGLAYIAAGVKEGAATLTSVLDGTTLPSWTDGPSATWDARQELYSTITTGPLMPDDPELFLTAMELERATLAALGFEFRGGGFWRTSTTDQMNARLQRALAVEERMGCR